VKAGTNGAIIRWPTSVPGYTLESSTNLPGAWSPAGEIVQASGRQKTIQVIPGATNRFFRLRSVP
jgi:hypothetical protein